MIDLLEVSNEEVLVWVIGVIDGDGVSVGEGIELGKSSRRG